MKTFFSPKTSSIVTLGMVLGCGGLHPAWAVTAGSQPEAVGDPLFTVSPVVSYVAIRLAKDNPDEARLNAVKVTNSGRVLLSLSNSTYSDGAVVGGRWYQGVLSLLNGPIPAFTNYPDTTVGRTVNVADMNDQGDVIGSSGNSYFPDEIGYEPFSDDYGLLWKPDSSSPLLMADSLISDDIQRGRYWSWRLLPEFINSDGSIYGYFFNQYYGVGGLTLIQDGVRWTTSLTNPGRLGVGSNSVDAGGFSVERHVEASSSGGQVIYSLITHQNWGQVTDMHFEVSGRSFMNDAPNLFTPRFVNDAGRFVGRQFDDTLSVDWLLWGEAQGDLKSLGTGSVQGINNNNVILTQNAEGISRLWRWEPDANGVSVYKAYGLRVSDNLKIFGVASLNDSDVVTGMVGQVIDDQGIAIPEAQQQAVPSLLVPAELAVDANHDGQIKLSHEATTVDESDLTSKTKPFRFSANDDDDVDTTSSTTITETTGTDWQNNRVDGADDLRDFFPVFLDIKQLLTVLPPSASIKYKLKQEESALNFVYTSLTRATAFDYEDPALATTGYGPGKDKAAAEAPTHQIAAAGFDIFQLAPDLVARIKDQDQGVILLELRGMSAKQLKLVVEKDGTQIAEVAVDIATGEIKWESIYSNNPVEDFKVPASYATYTTKDLKWLEGKRYFTDGDGPTATFHRTRINVKVKMAGAAGKSVKLKAFDVDDPTPTEWDASPAVIDTNDTNGPAGDDNNLHTSIANPSSMYAGTFTTSTTNTITTTLDENGMATVELITSQKPGANFRIAAQLTDSAGELDALQVTNSTASKYVSSSNRPVRNFGGVASPTLTVWRKLWIEIDSMTARLSGLNQPDEQGVVENYQVDTPITDRIRVQANSLLNDDEDYYAGGRLWFDFGALYILGNSDNSVQNDYIDSFMPGSVAVSPSFNLTLLPGSLYKIRDDDDRHLEEQGVTPVLPMSDERRQLIIANIKPDYAPAFIEIMSADAAGLNLRPEIAFELNAGNPNVPLPSIFNNAQDLDCTDYFWSHTVVLGYQPSGGSDADPASEGADYGLTGVNMLGNPIVPESRGFSAIYVEMIREGTIQNTPLVNLDYVYDYPAYDDEGNKLIVQRKFLGGLYGVIAHEIGHGCGGQWDDHYEMGLMTGGQISNVYAYDLSALTIKRFREIRKWR